MLAASAVYSSALAFAVSTARAILRMVRSEKPMNFAGLPLLLQWIMSDLARHCPRHRCVKTAPPRLGSANTGSGGASTVTSAALAKLTQRSD